MTYAPIHIFFAGLPDSSRKTDRTPDQSLAGIITAFGLNAMTKILQASEIRLFFTWTIPVNQTAPKTSAILNMKIAFTPLP